MSLRNHDRPQHPQGWEPGITWDGTTGEISSGALDTEPTDAIWQELVKDWGVGGNVQIIPGSVQVRAWDAFVGGEMVRMRYYRARLEPSISTEDRADIDALCALVEKRGKAPAQAVENGDKGLVVALSDWQAGKTDINGGTPEFVERLMATFDRLELHAKKHRKVIGAIYLVGLGDLIENCGEHYSAQTFSVDLDRREQCRLVRRLILNLVDRLVKLGVPIILGAVPGNHGENRRGGKAFTNVFQDNDDLAVVEQVAEILAANSERYGRVSVPTGAIAEDHTMTLDVMGVAVGFAHGHQIKGGAPTWWVKQAHGRQEIGHADILVTGHYHHLAISESSGRTWMQSPAMDAGSRWYTAQSGASAPAGMLTFLAGESCGDRGWSDLAVL